MACRIVLQGESAVHTANKHKEKLNKHPFDCGVDIYPTGIKMTVPDASMADQQPEYDVMALNDHQNLICVHTNLKWTPCPQTFALLTERSSSIEKLCGGRVVQGIIDAGYQGEIIVRVLAHTEVLDDVISGLELCILEKLAIAQMISIGFFYPGFEMITPGNIIVPMGGRGTNGFGSTDKLS